MRRDYSLVGSDGRLALEKGLAGAEWYRSSIPRKRLKELMQRRDGPAVRDTLIWFAALGLTGGLGSWFWGSWWAVPFFAAYGTAKAALSFLTQELAQEFAPKVRVNAIAVGATKTDALNTVLTPEIEKTMVDLTPMARLGEVEDIAACALYLASPAASYVTGEVLGVSGGLNGISMKMPRAFE